MYKKLLTTVTTLTFVSCGLITPAAAYRTTATYYSNYYNGRKMANGKRFSQNAMVAAHPYLKLGTRIRVTHKSRSIIVRISDRCHCTLDLSQRAFRALAPLHKGRIPVRIKKL